MENCYNGIVIPSRDVPACDGEYKSTDCILSPTVLSYLGLPVNASQTEINNAIQNSLAAKDELIEGIDGSETKIIQGTNITVTGTGTSTDPYLISGNSGGSQDLQSVVSAGNYAEEDGGNSYIQILAGGLNNRSLEFTSQNGLSGNDLRRGYINISNNSLQLSGNYGSSYAGVSMEFGLVSLFQQTESNQTTLLMDTPVSSTNIFLPAKSIAGNYTLATLEDITAPSYKVYTALISQSGTDAPTAIVLENTLGNVVWTRVSEGIYIGTLTGAFTTNKTFCPPYSSNFDVGGDASVFLPISTNGNPQTGWINIYFNGENSIEIDIYDMVGRFEWSSIIGGGNLPIEIRVYN